MHHFITEQISFCFFMQNFKKCLFIFLNYKISSLRMNDDKNTQFRCFFILVTEPFFVIWSTYQVERVCVRALNNCRDLQKYPIQTVQNPVKKLIMKSYFVCLTCSDTASWAESNTFCRIGVKLALNI